MEIKKAIRLLEELSETTGLEDPANWDDTEEIRVWMRESQEAIELAVKALKEGKIVGIITMNGKTYKIVE